MPTELQTDHDLLVGALALQTGLIDSGQFAEACKAPRARGDESLQDVLAEHGWLLPADKPHLEYFVQRALERHHHDARATLASLPSLIRQSLAVLDRLDAGHTIADSALPSILQPPSTLALDPAVEMRYTYRSVHGSGGIGQVWLARDRHLDREVAVKELLPKNAGNAKIAARFVREARLTGKLEHPGIVPVYELASKRSTGQPFYTMRLVRGRTLSDAVAAYHEQRAAGRAEPLDFAGLLTAFAAVCNTIAYAHSRGVLHRDLKGDNVILGAFGEVIVLDWGLAKSMGEPDEENSGALGDQPDGADNPGLTLQGEILGTPAYMAPEQANGQLDQIDHRTDIFGLGAILYEILSGQPPFVGFSTMDVLLKAARGNPPPPQKLWKEVPGALEEACLKAMALEREKRYDSAAELAQAVQRWQDEQRRRAEDALRRQTEVLSSILNSMSEGVLVADTEGTLILMNPAAERLIVRPPNATLAAIRAVNEFYRPDMATPIDAQDLPLTRAIQGAAVDDEEMFIRAAGTGIGICASANARPLRDESGKVRGGVVAFRDMTERKRAERRLAAQHTVTRVLAESQDLADAVPKILQAVCDALHWDVGGMWQVDHKAGVLRLAHFWHSPGVRVDEFEAVSRKAAFPPGIGLPGRVWANGQPAWIPDVIQDSNFPRAPAAAREGLHGALGFPVHVPSAGLSSSPGGVEEMGDLERKIIAVFEFFSAAIEQPDEDLLEMLSAVGSQIGQFLLRDEARKALRASEEQYHSLADLIPGIVWTSRPDGWIDYANQFWFDFTGMTLEQTQGSGWAGIVHPDDAPMVFELWSKSLQTGEPVEVEYRLKRAADGVYRWFLARGKALRDAEGRIVKWFGMLTEIDDQKRIEADFRSSKSSL